MAAAESYRPGREPREYDQPLRGVRYRVREWGPEEGRPILLLHGWGDCGATWQFLVDRLPANWRLVAPDWRGFGDSAWNHGAYWFPDYLADLDALVTTLFPERAVELVGHSMGGNVAALFAAVRPEKVLKLASLEGFGLRDTPPEKAPGRYRQWLDEVRAAEPFQTYDDSAALARRLVRRHPYLPLSHALFVADAWTRRDEAGRLVIKTDPGHRWVNPVLYRRGEAEACWQAIEAPVLFLLARESHFWTAEAARFIDPDYGATHYRQLQEQWLEACGHMFHWERPEAVAGALVDFFGQA